MYPFGSRLSRETGLLLCRFICILQKAITLKSDHRHMLYQAPPACRAVEAAPLVMSAVGERIVQARDRCAKQY